MDGTFLLPETDLLTPPPLPPSVAQLGVTGVPPVERSVAMQVCPSTVSTRQGKLCLLFRACRYSSGLILRGLCGLWRCCLHLTLRRYCRFFRLKALRDMHGGGHNPEVLKELRTAPDLAPQATKVMARSLGVAKQHAVGPSHSSLPPNLHPVVRPFVPSVRSALGTGLQARCGLHGCLRQGLVQRACCVGGLNGSPTALAHQLPRVAGSTPGLEPSQETLTRRAHTDPYRHHCDRRMSQLARHLLLWSRKHLRSLRAIHIPGLFNRTADELSRAALPGEWRLRPQTVQLIWRHFRLARTGRPVHVTRDVSLPVVLLPDRRNTRHGRTGTQLAAGPSQVCISPSEPSRTDTVQDQGGRGADPARGAILAYPDLVPRADAPPDSPSLADSSEERSTDSLWHPRPDLWKLHDWSLDGTRSF